MKLYYGMKKRQAKKLMGSRRWRNFGWAIKLKPGDLVNTCAGWNERVTSIEVKYSNWINRHPKGSIRERVKGKYVCSIYINTRGLSFPSCDANNCAEPAWTRDQVIQFHRNCEYRDSNYPDVFDEDNVDQDGIYHGPVLSYCSTGVVHEKRRVHGKMVIQSYGFKKGSEYPNGWSIGGGIHYPVVPYAELSDELKEFCDKNSKELQDSYTKNDW